MQDGWRDAFIFGVVHCKARQIFTPSFPGGHSPISPYLHIDSCVKRAKGLVKATYIYADNFNTGIQERAFVILFHCYRLGSTTHLDPGLSLPPNVPRSPSTYDDFRQSISSRNFGDDDPKSRHRHSLPPLKVTCCNTAYTSATFPNGTLPLKVTNDGRCLNSTDGLGNREALCVAGLRRTRRCCTDWEEKWKFMIMWWMARHIWWASVSGLTIMVGREGCLWSCT
jgi:hypothetical protein